MNLTVISFKQENPHYRPHLRDLAGNPVWYWTFLQAQEIVGSLIIVTNYENLIDINPVTGYKDFFLHETPEPDRKLGLTVAKGLTKKTFRNIIYLDVDYPARSIDTLQRCLRIMREKPLGRVLGCGIEIYGPNIGKTFYVEDRSPNVWKDWDGCERLLNG